MTAKLWVIFLLFFSCEGFARNWHKIQIPGARCGNGDPYHVFVSKKGSSKLAVMFEGGGACWDYFTCSTRITTRLKARKWPLGKESILSEDPVKSPIPHHDIVYFPYCTGDLFAGNHVANYMKLKKVWHVGQHNVVSGFEYLEHFNFIDFKSYQTQNFFGYSAGAIGLMMNFVWIDKNYTTESQRKTVILDGMGLHWNHLVWKRFPPKMLKEISSGFKAMGIPFDTSDGMIAKYAPTVCALYPNYDFGILQGSMDLVMGTFFGYMNPITHRSKVYSNEGIYHVSLNPKDNCAAWVPDTFHHTFLDNDRLGRQFWSTKDGTSAISFTKEILNHGAGLSYK